jgi:sporulation protein YlmC with PRC-barrel domain
MPGIEPARASELIGRTVYRPDGKPLGRIADLVVETEGRAHPTVVSVIVSKGLWGRLLGYERESAHGPWLLEAFARFVLRRNSYEVAWDKVLW